MVCIVLQFKVVRNMNVSSNNNANSNASNTPNNDEESDVMTTMEKLEAEAKDVSYHLAFFVFTCVTC